MTRTRIILLLATVMAVSVAPCLRAQDYVIHTVTKGQGLYSISRIYGVSEDDIIRLNPGSEKVIRIGQALRIPTRQSNQTAAPETVSETKTETVREGGLFVIKKNKTIYRICKDFDISEEEFLNANPQYRTARLHVGDTVRIPSVGMEPEPIRQPLEEDAKPEVIAQLPSDRITGRSRHVGQPNSVNAVMLLPLSLDDSVSSERAKMVEFTRGMLLAVKDLKDEGISVNLKVIDAGTEGQSLDKIIEDGGLDSADVVFGPKWNNQIEQAAVWSTQHNTPLVLPFNSNSDMVYGNPHVFQLNTPQSFFHQEIYDHFMTNFPDPNIIVLNDGTVKHNEMLDGLKRVVFEHGLSVTTIQADTAAVNLILSKLDSQRQNVFIIDSPEIGPLLTMLPVLQLVSRTKADGIRTCLFGYPEYQYYAAEHLDKLCECDTWFYSWFFTNNTLKESEEFGLNFIKSFNRQVMVSYPSYAPYGYDTGYYFLRGLALYGDDFESNLTNFRTKSVQMGFKFQRIDQGGGFINNKVFFAHFSPEYEVEKIDFDE